MSLKNIILDLDLNKFEYNKAIELLYNEIVDRKNEIRKNGYLTIEDNIKYIKRIKEGNLIDAFNYFFAFEDIAVFIDRDEETFDIISVNLNTDILFPKELKIDLDNLIGWYKKHDKPVYIQNFKMNAQITEGDYLYFMDNGELNNWESALIPDMVYKIYDLDNDTFKLKKIKEN